MPIKVNISNKWKHPHLLPRPPTSMLHTTPTTILHLLQSATLMEHPLPMAYQGKENTIELRIYHLIGNIQRVFTYNIPITLQQIRAPLGSLAMKPMINAPNLEPTNHHNVSHLQCSQAMPHPSGTLNLKHSKRIHPPFKHYNLLSRPKHCKLVQQSPHNTPPSPTTYDHHLNAQTPKSHKQLKLRYNQHMGNRRKQTMWPTKFPSPYCPLQEADTCLPPPIVQVH